tara:strand:+ start:563 stop:670 length:108 start_codon:yes stop_codon:yes gene_type:complete
MKIAFAKEKVAERKKLVQLAKEEKLNNMAKNLSQA